MSHETKYKTMLTITFKIVSRKSLCGISQTYTVLCISYNSIKLEEKKKHLIKNFKISYVSKSNNSMFSKLSHVKFFMILTQSQ